jgi:hypothetical protein
MQITREEYEQLSSEILEASVSIWNDNLTDCEDGITIDALWNIFNKYFKIQEDVKVSN